MEANGFALDVSYCDQMRAVAVKDEADAIVALRVALGTLGIPPLPGADDIWSSPKQMGTLLHGHLGAPKSPVWKKGRVKDGETKIDQVALEWIALREPRLKVLIDGVIHLRRTRGCVKYLTKLPQFVGPDGRVHPVCGPAGDSDDRAGALTGRLAMKCPEGQQIPQDEAKDPYRIRRAFVAPPGMTLVVADYSALEVVLLAHLCLVLFEDGQLAEMVAPGAPDIHCVNARRVFGEFLGWTLQDGRRVADLELAEFKNKKSEAGRLRNLIKSIWYGLMYGKGAYGFGASLTDDLGNPIGEDLAGKIVNALLDAVPAIRRYQEWVRGFIMEHGGIPSLAGRWCPLADLIAMGSKWAVDRAWRRALNFPMQAGAADVVGAAMVAVFNDPVLRRLGFKMILQIHDEIIIEGPVEHAKEACARLKWLMEHALILRVALQVSAKIAANWEDGK